MYDAVEVHLALVFANASCHIATLLNVYYADSATSLPNYAPSMEYISVASESMDGHARYKLNETQENPITILNPVLNKITQSQTLTSVVDPTPYVVVIAWI